MTHPLFPASLLIALAPAASAALPPLDRVELAQVTIHQRIVIRIPRIFGRSSSDADNGVRWIEKKGPKCVPSATIGGAVITGPDSVDLVVVDGTRLRARFEDDCPALDFYSGLYIKRSPDGLICADRDSIRARSGSVCRIDGFKRLVVKR